MSSGVIMVKHNWVFLATTLDFYSSFQAIELSQVDIAVNAVLLSPISLRNRPFMLDIVFVSPITKTLLANFTDDFTVNNPRAVPPYTPHGLLTVKVVWNGFRRLATVNAHLLSFDFFEEKS